MQVTATLFRLEVTVPVEVHAPADEEFVTDPITGEVVTDPITGEPITNP